MAALTDSGAPGAVRQEERHQGSLVLEDNPGCHARKYSWPSGRESTAQHVLHFQESHGSLAVDAHRSGPDVRERATTGEPRTNREPNRRVCRPECDMQPPEAEGRRRSAVGEPVRRAGRTDDLHPAGQPTERCLRDYAAVKKLPGSRVSAAGLYPGGRAEPAPQVDPVPESLRRLGQVFCGERGAIAAKSTMN